MNNAYKGKKLEFHILQSFPVTCLNRDDVGAPKTAIVGGVTRARVSSQAWKRQVRLAMHDFGIKLAVRTKFVEDKIARYCSEDGASEEVAKEISNAIAAFLTKDTLHFFTDTEAKALAEYAKEIGYDKSKLGTKGTEVKKVHKKALGRSLQGLEGLDIALFGRMVAQAAELNVEAAASFSHAISTHKANSEVEFFTAIDDEKPEALADSGSSHMGSLEFNSATYYRYVSIDLGQLVDTLDGDDQLDKALEAFIKALYVAVPYARQATQSGSNLWDYARILVRKGQRVQASFDNPVKAKGEGFLKPSIEALDTFLDKREKLSGSLYGKIDEFRWGIDENFSIDDLIAGVQKSIRG
ncbi:MAG: type I-E CRISPR-associated protein Cas7/Cse4/CasC [Sphaerochaeta sp.]|nr:type I-E CRISPR-associated protein Cas7/Cse4/CasC [Sphaerochaeta sp.]